MVPHITAEGTSFYGAFLYYFHDKGERTRNRIGFTETLNMLTDQVDKAWRVMAFTAKHANHLKRASGQKTTGAKLKKTVFSYSLAWHPEQKPDQEAMMQAAKESLSILGLSEHEAMIAQHMDEPHPHIHIVVNKVHPLTGLVAKLKYTKDKLSDFAREFQRREGTHYCPQREENHAKRKAGQKTKYIDPVIADAWQFSSNGAEFKHHLNNHGYQLARGRKCIVIVDARGKTANAARALGIKSKELKAHLGAFAIAALKTVEQVISDRKAAKEQDKPKPCTTATDDQAIEFSNQRSATISRQHGKQWDECRSLLLFHDRKITRARSELSQYYALAEKQAGIAQLQVKQEKSGFLQKLFGLHKKRSSQLEQLREKLSDAQRRFDDAIRKLEHEKQSALKSLQQSHSEDRHRLERSFEQWRATAEFKKQANRRAHGIHLPRSNDSMGFDLEL